MSFSPNPYGDASLPKGISVQGFTSKFPKVAKFAIQLSCFKLGIQAYSNALLHSYAFHANTL